MIGAQTILKATQAVRTAVPARSLTIISAPARNKVSKGEFIGISAIFIVANFAYPTYVMHQMAEKRRNK